MLEKIGEPYKGVSLLGFDRDVGRFNTPSFDSDLVDQKN